MLALDADDEIHNLSLFASLQLNAFTATLPVPKAVAVLASLLLSTKDCDIAFDTVAPLLSKKYVVRDSFRASLSELVYAVTDVYQETYETLSAVQCQLKNVKAIVRQYKSCTDLITGKYASGGAGNIYPARNTQLAQLGEVMQPCITACLELTTRIAELLPFAMDVTLALQAALSQTEFDMNAYEVYDAALKERAKAMELEAETMKKAEADITERLSADQAALSQAVDDLCNDVWKEGVRNFCEEMVDVAIDICTLGTMSSPPRHAVDSATWNSIAGDGDVMESRPHEDDVDDMKYYAKEILDIQMAYAQLQTVTDGEHIIKEKIGDVSSIVQSITGMDLPGLQAGIKPGCPTTPGTQALREELLQLFSTAADLVRQLRSFWGWAHPSRIGLWIATVALNFKATSAKGFKVWLQAKFSPTPRTPYKPDSSATVNDDGRTRSGTLSVQQSTFKVATMRRQLLSDLTRYSETAEAANRAVNDIIDNVGDQAKLRFSLDNADRVHQALGEPLKAIQRLYKCFLDVNVLFQGVQRSITRTTELCGNAANFRFKSGVSSKYQTRLVMGQLDGILSYIESLGTFASIYLRLYDQKIQAGLLMLNDLNTRLDLPSTSANRLDAPTQNLIGWAMDTQKHMAKLVEVHTTVMSEKQEVALQIAEDPNNGIVDSKTLAVLQAIVV